MRTKIIGVLNVTPDSFSDGGRFLAPLAAAAAARRMCSEGADIIDVGAVSTKPGASPVSAEEELRRLRPALDAIIDAVGTSRLCVDAGSTEASVLALSLGIRRLNLCGGFEGAALARECAAVGASAIVYPSHASCGRTSVIEERLRFMREQMAIADVAGMPPSHLWLDPGPGFGLDAESSILLLREFARFAQFGRSLVVAVSRKRHLATLMGDSQSSASPHDRLSAGLAAAATTVLRGATYVRTHDVLETARFFSVFDRLHAGS